MPLTIFSRSSSMLDNSFPNSFREFTANRQMV